MSNEYNKPLSCTDKQLVHQLRAYGYSLQDIADSLGIAKSTVVKVLKQDIKALVENADNYQEQYLGDGCYRTSHYVSDDDGIGIGQQSLAYYGDDPTFEYVAEWEEQEQLIGDYPIDSD